MKDIGIKQKIKDGRLLLGSWITLSHPSIAEIMSESAFDWLVVDMEHSAISLSDAQALIRVMELKGTAPLVRVGENSANLIKRVMDAGAHGVVVPMVNSAADAERAVSAVKYPPRGTRGVGLARAQKYGFGFSEYLKWNQENSIVIVQIEHIDAVNNFEEILAVDGVDGFIIGPYDLSGSLGVPGEFENENVKRALDRVKEVSRKSPHIMPGFHVVDPDPDMLREKYEEGYRFLGYGLDTIFLGKAVQGALSPLKDLK
ncbi:MAG: 2,4-dihydroxyhept-2-ene-1,7-dioic acid aldolase [Deltaproteobacteria bacterium]|nr:2,4-dihydroxyhept-2-ene-1,7-dioic acid aldolase [Candidatus Zymogenaceae bacterium]